MARTWTTLEVHRLLEYLGGELRDADGEDVFVFVGRASVPVPRNRKVVRKGTFGSICRIAGVTVPQANEIRRKKFK